jgi:hypothetical protein
MSNGWVLRAGHRVVLRGRRPSWLTGVCVVGLVGVARSALLLVRSEAHSLPIVTYLTCLAGGISLARLLAARGGPAAPRVASVVMGATSVILLDFVRIVPRRPVQPVDLISASTVVLGVVLATLAGGALCRVSPDRRGARLRGVDREPRPTTDLTGGPLQPDATVLRKEDHQ